MYNTVFATLANHLYDRGLPSEQQSIVDEAQLKGIIDYKQDNQIAAVRDIIELVAVDSPIANVSRLITSFHRVTNCRRHRNKDLRAFVSRFRGLAADHLMHGGLSSSSQVGEVLAITLLNNANLSEETLTNTKLQLFALAKERDDNDNKNKEEFISIPKTVEKDISTLLEKVDEFKESILLKTFKTDSIRDVKARIHTLKHGFTTISSTLSTILTSLEKLNDDQDEKSDTKLIRSPPRCRLNLDDAVSVLRNLSFTPAKEAPSYTKSELDHMVNQRVQKALLAYTSHNTELSATAKEPRKGKSKKSKKSGTATRSSPKLSGTKRLRCYDCGSTDHERGSDDCSAPSFWTKKLKSEGFYDRKNDHNRTKTKKGSSRGASDSRMNVDFQQGSGPTKRNHH